MPPKNLTVRLDDEVRTQLELIANRELRPMANQIVVFVRQGIARYLDKEHLYIREEKDYEDGSITYSLENLQRNPFAPTTEQQSN